MKTYQRWIIRSDGVRQRYWMTNRRRREKYPFYDVHRRGYRAEMAVPQAPPPVAEENYYRSEVTFEYTSKIKRFGTIEVNLSITTTVPNVKLGEALYIFDKLLDDFSNSILLDNLKNTTKGLELNRPIEKGEVTSNDVDTWEGVIYKNGNVYREKRYPRR